ncbi:MAG: ATP-binding protein [Kofleriaceae bacterium]|nr:ATP-binding protein [Kofleriaceae bacterium]
MAIDDSRLLQMIASGMPLLAILASIARDLEARIPDARVAIMSVRNERLSLLTAPSLAPGFTRSFDGSWIGEGGASAGVAVARHETVIVADVATDPVFASHRELARAFDIRAAWSTPVIGGPEGGVLGTIDLYFSMPTRPTEPQRALLARAAALAAVGLERDHREERLRHLQRTESIGRLSAGIAHDFNNILSVVTICGNMLKERLAGPDLELVNEIVEAGNRGANLTAQILAYSRRQVMRPEQLDLNRVIHALDPLLRHVLTEDIGFTLALAPDLWEVQADPSQIEQVIVHLVGNARDAMPHGGMLTITTSNVEATDLGLKGPHVRLAVTDTGRSLDPQTCNHVFEPYTTEGTTSGPGLGLAIVQGIVQQSGGDVCVTSTPDVGTTFEVYLPRAYTRLPAQPGPTTSTFHSPSASLAILVVEDDPALRKTFGLSLESMRFHARIVGSAQEALEATDRGFVPDLVVTDTVLPGMNGKQLAQRLREKFPALRVLYTSGYPDVTLASRGVLELEKGAQFLAKPFTLRGLAEAIARTTA